MDRIDELKELLSTNIRKMNSLKEVEVAKKKPALKTILAVVGIVAVLVVVIYVVYRFFAPDYLDDFEDEFDDDFDDFFDDEDDLDFEDE